MSSNNPVNNLGKSSGIGIRYAEQVEASLESSHIYIIIINKHVLRFINHLLVWSIFFKRTQSRTCVTIGNVSKKKTTQPTALNTIWYRVLFLKIGNWSMNTTNTASTIEKLQKKRVLIWSKRSNFLPCPSVRQFWCQTLKNLWTGIIRMKNP